MEWRKVEAAAMVMGVEGGREKRNGTAPPDQPFRKGEKSPDRRKDRSTGETAEPAGETAGQTGQPAEPCFFKDVTGIVSGISTEIL